MKAETPQLAPGEVITEVVEEFISIADGQVGLPRKQGRTARGWGGVAPLLRAREP